MVSRCVRLLNSRAGAAGRSRTKGAETESFAASSSKERDRAKTAAVRKRYRADGDERVAARRPICAAADPSIFAIADFSVSLWIERASSSGSPPALQ
jgi:hypothetical protein